MLNWLKDWLYGGVEETKEREQSNKRSNISKTNKLIGLERVKKEKNELSKLDMYDMILANLAAGDDIIEPNEKLDSGSIHLGFSNVASNTHISKFFIIDGFPDWMEPDLMLIDLIRNKCTKTGVKFDFYIYSEPHQINWNSHEMANRMRVWRNFSEETDTNIGVFDYRKEKEKSDTKSRLTWAVRFFNLADLDYKRTTQKITIKIKVTAVRNTEYLINAKKSIATLKSLAKLHDFRIRELRINIIDWLARLGPFSLKEDIKEVNARTSKKLITDDIMAKLNTFKQGRIGTEGVCLGIDVISGSPVLKKFKKNPDEAENWLISASTGGGKSMYVKALATYLLADGFVVTIMDYEGDEYTDLANYIRAGNREDVKVISMGRGSTEYFDPMEIQFLTGEDEIDEELKENAINFTIALFRIIICGLDNDMSTLQEKILSTAIRNVYESRGITEDKNTWELSRGVRISMVYEELKLMEERKIYVDEMVDNVKHKELIKIIESSSKYFEEGESGANTFKKAISVNELFKAKFLVFSFGMRGAANSISDKTILALRQLSVACVSIQISNYCKYIRRCFNLKVWEEYQRWGDARGSSEIISNAMTAGRKRGDVNFLITNDLQSILDDSIEINKRIRQNIQSYAIGVIKDEGTRRKFCEMFSMPEIKIELDRIARGSRSNISGDKYKFAFCVILEDGNKAIVKVMLPKVITESKIFKTGVQVV